MRVCARVYVCVCVCVSTRALYCLGCDHHEARVEVVDLARQQGPMLIVIVVVVVVVRTTMTITIGVGFLHHHRYQMAKLSLRPQCRG